MNKQDAIMYLENGRDGIMARGDTLFSDAVQSLTMAIEALQDDWIPVSEKQPSQTGEYLVTVEYDGGVTFTDKFGYTPTADGGWYDPEEPNQTHIDWNKYVIAWMPLPEPYKE